MRAVAVHAALVDAADEEFGTALVAALADLPQQLLERDAGLFCPALAEVVAVGPTRVGRYFGMLQPWRLSPCGQVRCWPRTPRRRAVRHGSRPGPRRGVAGGSRLCWRCSWPRFSLDPPPRSLGLAFAGARAGQAELSCLVSLLVIATFRGLAASWTGMARVSTPAV